MDKIKDTTQMAQFLGRRDVIVLMIGASRADGEHITDGQKDAAMNAAKSVLQVVGAEVDAVSTAFLLQDADVAEGDALYVRTTAELFKQTPEEPATQEETQTEPEAE